MCIFVSSTRHRLRSLRTRLWSKVLPWRRCFRGARLRRLREERGLTQAALAQALDLSTSYVNQLENDQRPITVPVLIALTERFDLPPQYFSSDTDARLVGRPVRPVHRDRRRTRRNPRPDRRIRRSHARDRSQPGYRPPSAARRHRRAGRLSLPRDRRHGAAAGTRRCRSRRSATSSMTATTTSAISTSPPSSCGPRVV